MFNPSKHAFLSPTHATSGTTPSTPRSDAVYVDLQDPDAPFASSATVASARSHAPAHPPMHPPTLPHAHPPRHPPLHPQAVKPHAPAHAHAPSHGSAHGHERHSVAESETEDHRKRFLSDTERLLAEHPRETKASFAASLDGGNTSNDPQQPTAWHLEPMERLVKLFTTDLRSGLTTGQYHMSKQLHGDNVLEQEKTTPLWILFALQFYNLIVGMLLIAVSASLILGEFVEGIAILFIVLLNATIATYQEQSASQALQQLAKLTSPQSVVIRDGTQDVINSQDIVPGDLIVLCTGDVVPADARLVESSDFKVNEMLLTGEPEDVSKKSHASGCSGRPNASSSVASSAPMKKLTAENMVFASTTVTAGNATAIVVATGMKTRVGAIAQLLKSKGQHHQQQQENETPKKCDLAKYNPIAEFAAKYQPKLTPLQRSLHRLGFVMGAIALTVCALVFVLGMVRGITDPSHLDRPKALSLIMVAVSLAVSAVPEGLPMVVTICLSSGTSDMVKKNVLVRKLAAVETLGAASVICTDKTGTLTEGKMTAVRMWGDSKLYEITGKGFNPEGGIYLDGVNQCAPGSGNVQIRSTLLSCVLCSNTKLNQIEDEDGVMQWIPRGNSSEAPLIVAAAKAGIWEEYVSEDYKRVVEVPFTSSRKMMMTVHSVPSTGMFGTLLLPAESCRYVVCAKGAPNVLLGNCMHFCETNGSIKLLEKHHRDEIMQAVDDLSSQALRVLAVAIRPLSQLPFDRKMDDVDEKFRLLKEPLVFLGLIASIDPERDGVRDAIGLARKASIRTVMITGDYLKTAVAIAKNIDLLQVGADPNEEATDCSQLRPRGDGEYLTESEIDEITSRTLVFARAKPEDKLEIVKSLQRQGLIAAMTGDGVNDAPALKESDIGVAMGVSGTEVAKGASDMVLMDDNFCSIVSAVEKGRVIYANIQKFVLFLLSTNIGEIILVFSSIAIGLPLPLEALQILILNLFSDGMPAVALSMEKGDELIMEDRPRPKKQPLIHGRLWFLVCANAFFIAMGAFVTFAVGVYWSFGTLLLSDILPANAKELENFENVTCQRWESGNGWRMYGNCHGRHENGTYIFDEHVAGMSYYETDSFVCYGGSYACMKDGQSRAQTMTFICITFTEVLRAFTVRSFTNPFYVGFFSNKFMHWAAFTSVLLTVLVTNVPGLMDDVFGFAYIAWYEWLLAIAGALNSVVWGELVKSILRRRDAERERWELVKDGFESVLFEIRHVQRHLERMESEGTIECKPIS